MKILITGAGGMLGREMAEYLPGRGHEVYALGRGECDITDEGNCREVLQRMHPEVVVNCAAMTAVDDCESDERRAYLINAVGVERLAMACAGVGAKLVQISTDYVFEGSKQSPYVEADAVNPKTVYGKSKLAGEVALKKHLDDYIIVRVAWLYGKGGPSFVHTMLKLAQSGSGALRVVDDQRGNPTSCAAVAKGVADLVEADCKGLFHLTCEGEASWYEFACEIFSLSQMEQEVVPCTSAEYPRPAPRPANSCLDNNALAAAGLEAMPHWKDALKNFILISGKVL